VEWVVTSARTIEEATEMALDQLGVDEQDAEIEVVQDAHAFVPRPPVRRSTGATGGGVTVAAARATADAPARAQAGAANGSPPAWGRRVAGLGRVLTSSTQAPERLTTTTRRQGRTSRVVRVQVPAAPRLGTGGGGATDRLRRQREQR
jgi:Jag N-terminus